MASDKRYSFRKIGSAVIKSQMNLWGGNKIPYLNSAVNTMLNGMIDPSSITDQFKVQRSDKDKIKRSRDKIDVCTQKLAIEEQKLTTMINGARSVLNQLQHTYVSILASDPSAFSTQPQYIVGKKLLRELDPTVSSVLTEKTYYKLKPNVLTPQIVKSYNSAIDASKKIEQTLFMQVAKIAEISRQLKSANMEIDSMIRDFRNRR